MAGERNARSNESCDFVVSKGEGGERFGPKGGRPKDFWPQLILTTSYKANSDRERKNRGLVKETLVHQSLCASRAQPREKPQSSADCSAAKTVPPPPLLLVVLVLVLHLFFHPRRPGRRLGKQARHGNERSRRKASRDKGRASLVKLSPMQQRSMSRSRRIFRTRQKTTRLLSLAVSDSWLAVIRTLLHTEVHRIPDSADEPARPCASAATGPNKRVLFHFGVGAAG